MLSSARVVVFLGLWLPGAMVMAGPLERAGDLVTEQAYAEALQQLEQLTGTDADNARARFLRGTALAGLGRVESATEVFEGLVRDYPSLPEPYNNLAALYARQGRLDDARAVLERAIRTQKSYATVYENLSSVYVEMARDSYAKALRMDEAPQDPQLDMLASLNNEYVVPPRVESAVTPGSTATAASGAAPEPEAPVASAPVAQAPEPPPAETTEAPASEAAGLPTIDAAAQRREAVIDALRDWARAWANQAVDTYVDAYVDGYIPDATTSHSEWAAQRRSRLRRPEYIRVQLSDITVRVNEKERVAVEFVQDYDASNYSDRTRKEIYFVKQDGRWRIASEQTLEVIERR